METVAEALRFEIWIGLRENTSVRNVARQLVDFLESDKWPGEPSSAFLYSSESVPFASSRLPQRIPAPGPRSHHSSQRPLGRRRPSPILSSLRTGASGSANRN